MNLNPHDDFQSNDLTLPGCTHGGSSFLAFMLCARFFNDEVLSQSSMNVFATGGYSTKTIKYFYPKLFLYRNIFDCKYEEVKKKTQCNKDHFRTLENIEFAAIGMLEKKLANIFLYIKNNKLNDNAIFLSESQKKEVSSLKKKIKIVNEQINDENFLKCVDILNRINYVKNTKELQKLHQANIKTFNHLECLRLTLQLYKMNTLHY